MKRLILWITLALLLLAGCGAESLESTNDTTITTGDEGKLMISATLFPQYSFAKSIGGDAVDVEMVIPAGLEVHSFEPTPRTISNLRQSDLLLYTGAEMEPWLEDILADLSDAPVELVDLSSNVVLMASDDHDEDDHDEEDGDHDEEEGDHDDEGDEHDHGAYDPHYWLDPSNAIIMVEEIRDAMIEARPELEATFTDNASNLIQDIQTLDEAFYTYFETLDHPKIVYGGHFAFGYFTHRYDVEYISPFSSFSPDAEPTPQEITEIIDYINESEVKSIFYEELVSSKVAESIADETGAQMFLLNGVHNVTKDQIESGETYVSIMYQNLENLKKGLQ